MQTKIPKMSRNKYGVLNADSSNGIVTQSQLNSINNGGNGGGGTGGGVSWKDKVNSQVQHILYDRGLPIDDTLISYESVYAYYATKEYADDVKDACYAYADSKASYADLSAYVTKDELERASYVTQASLSGMSYITYNEVSQMSYITKQDVEDILSSYYDTDDEVDKKVEDSTRSNIVPSADNIYNLGSSAYNYASTYTYNLYINGVDIKTFIQDVIAGRV